jgi:hypothetical protein
MVKEKRVIDWEGIERDYIAGARSLRDIGSQYGIDEALIRRRAKKEGWARDLKAKIKIRAENIVRKREVQKAVRAKEVRKKIPRKKNISEQEIIETNANLQATVLLNERSDIKRLSGLSEKFEKELEQYKEDLEKKARIMKSLTDTRKTIIELRRRNYNINDNSNGDADESTKTITRIELIGVASIHVCS